MKEVAACGDASVWWASWWTPLKLHVLAAGPTSSSQKRWRNHFLFFFFFVILHLQHTKAPVCQREAKNPNLMLEEREKSAALIRSLSQPCRRSHPAAPTGVLPVCKRWEAGREPKRGENWQTPRYWMYSPPCYSSPAHPEASPKLLEKQINK